MHISIYSFALFAFIHMSNGQEELQVLQQLFVQAVSNHGGNKPDNVNRPTSGNFNQPGGFNRPGGGFNRPSSGNFNQPGGFNRPSSGNFNQPGGFNRPSSGNFNQPGSFNRPTSGSFNQPGGFNRPGGGFDRPGSLNQGGFSQVPVHAPHGGRPVGGKPPHQGPETFCYDEYEHKFGPCPHH